MEELFPRNCLTPSPGTPGEGRGEGDFERRTTFEARNHPNPLPAYRERGPDSSAGWPPSMFFLLGIWNGIGEIRAHKLRSLLTITCVLLGVASMVLIAAFITGLFRRWEVYSQEMGWAQKVQVEDQVP